ncbi:MAG: hypothetical protein PHW72_02125 [Candidatus Pacebacteria bacterium]|nr:hypothetical protein [Candidatus Paceibacterota bacterium]
MDAEKEAMKRICFDVVEQVLWDPRTMESHCETSEHDVKAWKSDGMVKVEIRRK